MPASKIHIIRPDWNAPSHITAFCTMRSGGVSEQGFASLNLAHHVRDKDEHVVINRMRLVQVMNLPAEPDWLQQTHSTRVIDLDRERSRDGDAAISRASGKIAVVLTADCLPVLLCDRLGAEVAAAHAGWRGLFNGVLEQTVLQMNSDPQDILAWMGPAIGPQKFEVGEEVRLVFVQQSSENEDFFVANRPGHYLADLYGMARLRLHNLGIVDVSGDVHCTYTESSRFFSYRREKKTGRQASMIYINQI